MTFPVPNLDDRGFADLVREARSQAMESCPQWRTDLSVHDPGMTLIEVFAHLTEVMLYRLNRLPEKSYLTYLNLIGLTRRPPSAAWADLTVTRDQPGGGVISVPAGATVTGRAGGSAPPSFVITESAVLAADAESVVVRAHHCTVVDAEPIGTGTGLPGQRYRAARAPIVSTTEPIDLLLGVQTPADGRDERRPAREHDGKVFEIWQPVDSFADADPDGRVYLLDRSTGTITFSYTDAPGGPALPPLGAEIRLWYRTGGGDEGNVGPDALTTLEPRIDGVSVTNPRPARGGRDLEAVDSALARGPHEFFSLHRAVTARDYEVLATAGAAGIARARAFTRMTVRPFARPGEVEVVVVPDVPRGQWADGRLDLHTLLEHHTDEARERSAQELSARGVIGTTCVTSWANYKEVAVKATVVVRPEEDPAAVRERVNQRLNRTISPLPTEDSHTGWPFGEPLRASTVYRLLEQAEPGVRYVDDVEFVVGEAPDRDARTVVADPNQPRTWYAGAGPVVFRSVNDGGGWEAVGRFPGEIVSRIVPAPRPVRAGMIARRGSVALVTRREDTGGSRVYLTVDLGDTWQRVTELEATVHDLAWIEREGAPALLLASDKGLYEIVLLPDAVPKQILVDSADPDRALYAVEAFISPRGAWGIAAAAQAKLGVYLSVQGGAPGSFGNIGPAGNAAVVSRCLAVQYDGPSTVLWVGTGEPDPAKPGSGCLRARMFESDVQWQALAARWEGGTCWDIAFDGRRVLAATQSAGVLMMDSGPAQPSWAAPDVNCGLPQRDKGRFHPMLAVSAVLGQPGEPGTAMACGPEPDGVYRTRDATSWEPVSHRVSTDQVTIPDTWLLCSGSHEIEVVGGYAQPVD